MSHRRVNKRTKREKIQEEKKQKTKSRTRREEEEGEELLLHRKTRRPGIRTQYMVQANRVVKDNK